MPSVLNVSKNLKRFMINYFNDHKNNFLTYLEKNLNYSPLTIYTYRINLTEALKYVDIVYENEHYSMDLMPYRMYIMEKNRKTIYKKISIFKRFVTYLKESGLVIRLLQDNSIKVPKTLPKPVSTKYIFEVLSNCEQEEKALILVAYSLGLRVSEISNLKIESITNGWVRIKGKGDKIRQLPLLKNVQTELTSYMKATSNVVYLFEKSGKKLSENQIRYRLQKVFKKAGIKVTPHQFRHAFATDLLEHGARITDVSLLLGHTSLETTQIYTKLSSSTKMQYYQKAHPLCGELDEST